MAELASGAVSSLLVVIRNETLLLSGVEDDVQFIKEEMESMNSFLAHLARSAPPGGEHNEQVLTWMNQVRLLAQDCNNCIDLYLYSGDPAIHRAKGRLRRYLWWVYWFLRKLVAQHRAAVQLRQLKDRAHDVGQRRLRYDVEVPGKSSANAAAAAEDEEDSEDQLMVAAFFEPLTLDDHVKAKLLEWLEGIPRRADETFSVAVIVEPGTYHEALVLARDTLVVPPTRDRAGYHRDILVNIPVVHLNFLPLRPKEVLYYILRELKQAKSQSHQKQGIDQGEGAEEGEGEGEGVVDRWQDHLKKFYIYLEKKKELSKVKENIKNMKIDEKLDKISSDIQGHQQMDRGDKQKLSEQGVDKLDLHVLLYLLIQSTAAASQQDEVKNTDLVAGKLPAWDDNIISKIAKKLKEHMEGDENASELQRQVGVEENEETAKEGGGEEQEEKEERDEGKKREEMEKEGEEDRKEEEIQQQQEEEEEEKDGEEDRKEDRDEEGPIRLHEDQYAQILREVFPKTTSSKPPEAERQEKSAAKQATKTMATALNQEQIKEIVHEANQEILRELREGKPDKNQAASEGGAPGQNRKADFEEIAQKIKKIKHKLKEHIKINWIVDKIKQQLKADYPLIILKVDNMMDGSKWEEIRQALSLLDCSADAVIFTTTKNTQQAIGYYYPPREPINYSLSGLYHDTVLELTNKHKNEENYNPQDFRDILELCEPHEFCMKIFTHALYANPKMSNELSRLHRILKDSPKSFDILAKKMFMYSYNDLPKEYKSCLLYLAIFPKGQKINRSTLIGRWAAEGLTLKEDWPSSLRQAHRCFDALIRRWFVYPADIGATGKVKSCVVGDLVHGFITTIARKQHFVETRLSHHLARHFSIFNDLQLRGSDGIDRFFQSLSKSSRVSLLKVLDLEGCQCFGGKKQRYLKDICTKMLLLKYLSLRGTDITHLPSEINYLRELEVLDIRQTKVPAYATANILLLKLKRLLAGDIDQSSSNFSSVQIPHRIDKMVNIETLSNVKARHSHNLKDIGRLWQLRKLGVVIQDQDRYLSHLLQTISDLHECLRSLSITTVHEVTRTIGDLHECLRSLSMSITTLPEATPQEGTPSSAELPSNISSRLRHHPKILESLSISGTTLTGHLLQVITKGGNIKLAKVTLSHTKLNQDGLNILAKLPELQCVKLRGIAWTEGMLTFKTGKFISLKCLLVEGSDQTNITFENGSAFELEKIVLSFTSTGSISGVDMLPKFKELELNNLFCGRLLPSFDNAKQIAKVTLRGTLLKQDALKILAKKPNLRCLELLQKSFDRSHKQITFNKDEFIWLNLLVVDFSSITDIVFICGSAPRLEKIVWSSFTSLSGIEKIPRLKELEFNGVNVPNEVKEAIKIHKNKPTLKHNEPETQDQARGDEEDDDAAARFPYCWNK